MKIVMRDKFGDPVETYIDEPFTNFCRYLIHACIVKTFFYKEKPAQPNPSVGASTDCICKDCTSVRVID